MSQAYVSGPVHCYVGVDPKEGSADLLNGGGRDPNKSKPIYLGTFQDAPKILTNSQWSPMMNDLWGQTSPFDMSYQGVYADIFGELTVWNWPVLTLCQTRPNVALTEGADNILSIGTMMVTEGYAYPLWLHFPYYQLKGEFGGLAGKTNAPPGYRYHAAWLMGPEEEDLGTKPNKVFVHFRGIRRVGSYAGGGATDTTNQFILRDRNMNGIPALAPASRDGSQNGDAPISKVVPGRPILDAANPGSKGGAL